MNRTEMITEISDLVVLIRYARGLKIKNRCCVEPIIEKVSMFLEELDFRSENLRGVENRSVDQEILLKSLDSFSNQLREFLKESGTSEIFAEQQTSS